VRNATAYLVLMLLLAACFTLATALPPHVSSWDRGGQSDSVMKVLLGDGRRIFANHFFEKADVYFHSGYYTSICDRANEPKDSHNMKENEEEHHEGGDHEKETDFLGPPKDWIERFGRHFFITKHTHLEGGAQREILPWLRLSAELDPQRVETYVVAAYWLRSQLGKVQEAQQFLREGLRANPNSYEILFALGRLYHENDHDPIRARNLWELALRRWKEQETGKPKPDNRALDEIAVNLARVEEEQGNLAQAIAYLEVAKGVSPAPETLQKQIEELKQKLSTPPQSPAKQR